MTDPRGPRFAAWTTTFVLVVVLLTGSARIAAVQAVVFLLGATGHDPYALFWTRILRRTPPVEPEPAAPPRFARAALGAAFRNAAFGICLGREIHLRLRTANHTEGATA